MGDIRYSARLLLKHPGFSLTAIAVLALGIGANAGIFGIINGALLRPLAGARAPGELVGVYSRNRTEGNYRAFPYLGFVDLREAALSTGPFGHLAAHNLVLGVVTQDKTTRQAAIDVVTNDYFTTLGVRPVFGRDFTLEEERPGAASRPVIISYKLWEQSGFDREILKQTVRINGQDLAIVGVAPRYFNGTTTIYGVDYYIPAGVYDGIDLMGEGGYGAVNKDLIVIARLKPGATRDQADAQLRVIAHKDEDLIVRTPSRLDIGARPQDLAMLWAPIAMLQGLAGAVLLTSCLNLANMMLAFGSARQKEIAIRLAIGGPRSRVVRQLLVQGLMLSVAGGVSGLIVATWSTQSLSVSMGTVLPFTLALDLRPDITSLFATLGFCTLATIAFGLWPALRLSRPDLLTALKDQTRGRIRVRGTLVTAQLAVSLALLVLSGLFVRAAMIGASTDPGFNIDPLVIAQIEPNLGGYNAVQGREARRAILERLRATPGIASVAEASLLPFGEYSSSATVQREGRRLKNSERDTAGKLAIAQHYIVSSDYFRTLGLTMRSGREFTAAEEAGVSGTMPVIIDSGLAERLFANENPIGRLLQYGADSGKPDSQPMLIVGVAPGVKHELFEKHPAPHIYTPSSASDAGSMFVFMRVADSQRVDNFVMTIREQLRAADPNLPVIFVNSFRSQHEGSTQVWILRAVAKMFLTLGLAATLVAVIGLYGVRSYLVACRTREFGVRMAVGASPGDVLRMVLREAIANTTAGLAIGLAIGILLGKGMSAVMYQISPYDPITMGGATAILAVSSLIASLVPARRAAKVMPMTALRND